MSMVRKSIVESLVYQLLEQQNDFPNAESSAVYITGKPTEDEIEASIQTIRNVNNWLTEENNMDDFIPEKYVNKEIENE